MTFEEILKEELGEDVVLDEVIDDAPVDSLEYFAFILRLEREFGVRLPETEVNQLGTFRELKSFAMSRLGSDPVPWRIVDSYIEAES